ncbi:MAG TPA: ATP-binding cassette domain-containing protein, partial [Thermomicrobiales bacterium]|nr:ATP-binding cassette domain-containing protein [Thermomicrobiales bacterium]
VGDDWDVEERAATVLGRLGLGDVELERTVGALSGGQATLLGLASRLLREPDVLLQDEPSNNLDIDARERLYDVVAGWRGCLVIASHDRDLLGRVDRIAEISADGIRLYGGAFDDYEAAVAAEHAAAAQAVRTAELDLKREKREAQEARERADRRASVGKRRARSGGIPPIVAGALQRKAEASAGRAGDLHERRLDAARERLAHERQALREEERIRIALPQTRVPAGRILFEADGATIALAGDAPIFGTAGIDLTIRGPERIALVGANGAGKTTLLRLVAGDLAPDAGRVRRYDTATIRTLPQRLDLLDDDVSVLANLRRFAPGVPDAELRNRLAGFLFAGDHAHLPAADLSGGERLRATLACLLAAEPSPQLLLLDEPTNNLDLGSVRQLEAALAAYEGALVVASHDLPFLAEIGVSRWLRLAPGKGLVAEDGDGRSGDRLDPRGVVYS